MSDDAIIGSYAVGTGPQRVVFDGINIWVTNTDSNSVTKLRASDGTRLADFSFTGAFGIVFDGAGLWVSSPNANKLGKF